MFIIYFLVERNSKKCFDDCVPRDELGQLLSLKRTITFHDFWNFIVSNILDDFDEIVEIWEMKERAEDLSLLWPSLTLGEGDTFTDEACSVKEEGFLLDVVFLFVEKFLNEGGICQW